MYSMCIPLLVNKAQRIRVLCQNTASCVSSITCMRRATPVNARRRLTRKRRNCWIKSLFLFSLCTKSIRVASLNYGETADVMWTILMSLLPLRKTITFRKLLDFIKNILICVPDERRSYGFGTTWRRVINDRSFIYWWNKPLKGSYYALLRSLDTRIGFCLI